MADQARRGGWKPGQSGNPRGREPGTGPLQKLRAALSKDVPAILKKLAAAAKAGDVQAARLILERVLPPVKAIEPATPIKLDAAATLTEKGEAILAAVAAGDLAPAQGAQLIAAIGTFAKVKEIDELEARISAIEKRHERKPQ